MTSLTDPEVRSRYPEKHHALAPRWVALSLDEVASGERRLDAEKYLSEGFLIWRTIERSAIRSPSLGDLADVWQPSRLKGITVDAEHGVPFLSAGQVFELWPTPRKWLAPERTPYLEQRYVRPNTILVTCSGTIGVTIMAYRPHLAAVISHDLLRVDVRADSMRGYLYTFLRSRFGRHMTRSSRYGNIIKHMEPAHLSEVPVPVIKALVGPLQAVIQRVYDLRDRAYDLDKFARQLLSREVGQPETPDDGEEGFTVGSTSLFDGRRRLDAYAHNPRAQAIRKLWSSRTFGTDRLSDLAALVLPSRFTRVYGETGTLFLGSEDIFKVNPEVNKRITSATKIKTSSYMVKSGWLLMARSGQIYGLNGSVVLASKQHEGKLISEHVIRIKPKPRVRSGYLQAVLAHPTLGQPLVLSRAFGTSIPELDPVDIGELPIVRLDPQKEEKIADFVESAAAMRMQADQDENGAVAKLEAALDEVLDVTTQLDAAEKLASELV